jgi:hypothetical protein
MQLTEGAAAAQAEQLHSSINVLKKYDSHSSPMEYSLYKVLFQ